LKFAENCEFRLFQRPDDAIHPGYDKQAERDFASEGNFFSNYQPLRRDDVREIFEDAVNFSKFIMTAWTPGPAPTRRDRRLRIGPRRRPCSRCREPLCPVEGAAFPSAPLS
jgi:hypothetical protein